MDLRDLLPDVPNIVWLKESHVSERRVCLGDSYDMKSRRRVKLYRTEGHAATKNDGRHYSLESRTGIKIQLVKVGQRNDVTKLHVLFAPEVTPKSIVNDE